MLAIRLARVGKKKHATFRLIVSEKSKDTRGDYLELLGSLNPHPNPPSVTLKAERIRYWIEHGAQPSATVHNLLVEHKIISGKKVGVSKIRRQKIETPPAPAAPAPTTTEKTTAQAPAAKEPEPKEPKPKEPEPAKETPTTA